MRVRRGNLETARRPPSPSFLSCEFGLVELPKPTRKDQLLAADAVDRQFFSASQGQRFLVNDRVRHRTTPADAALVFCVLDHRISHDVPDPAKLEGDPRL